jgi:asparagine synthase (glutamine-hydrolysing)
MRIASSVYDYNYMCGVGALLKLSAGGITYENLTDFNSKVRHRGPDGEGFALFSRKNGHWSISDKLGWSLALSHKRLSILDLSPAGSQPMSYADETLWLTFNGEIYNYVEIRAGLVREGYSFKSNSDTEVIVAAYHKWGAGCFEKFRGMWAIILLDLRTGKMIVSRDRMGIKPLYLFQKPGYIALASEIKQFTSLPGYTHVGNLPVIKQYLLTGFERSDSTFLKNVSPVLPGTYFEIDLQDLTISNAHSYWDPQKIKPSVKSHREAAELTNAVFDESVKIHLRSDVPVGCQLSGGVDSSSIFSLMNRHYSGESIHSFTIGFPGYEKDEFPIVQKMLMGSRAIQHVITPSPQNFLSELDDFIMTQDAPVGSFSQYAGFVLARLIGETGVKVVLNGQGGDELFGGYWQQYYTFLFQQLKSGRPFSVAGQLLGSLLPGGNEQVITQMSPFIKRYLSRRDNYPFHFTTNFKNLPSLNYLNDFFHLSQDERRIFSIRNLILPRLLKWDDRNLMRFSVEGRYPFLDHKVIEAALTFQESLLYKNGWTKYPLRKAMTNNVPKEILFRKAKWGFETPKQYWLSHILKNELADWIASEKPLAQIITHESLKGVAHSFWKGNKLEDAQLLFRVFLLDRWLIKMNVHLEN